VKPDPVANDHLALARALRRLGSVAVIVTALLIGACGGGHANHRERPEPAPPVKEQVREALLGALGTPAFTGLTAAHRPRLPYGAVASCKGPADGGAGRYRCVTTPRGRHRLRSVDVQVKSDGQWSTRPLHIETTFRGRRLSAVTAVWGVGIQLPG